MKLRTTKKQIKESGYDIISLGYCQADNILTYSSPFAYSSGAYGWSCDYYQFGNVIISTGYQPIGRSVNFDLVKKYNDNARAKNTREEVLAVLDQFIEVI